MNTPTGITLAAVGVFVLGALALLGYATVLEPRYLLDVRRESAPVPGLPEAWEGRKLALIADLQVGMWWHNTGMVRKAVATAIAEEPEAVLVAGDLLYKAEPEDLELAVSLIAPVVHAQIPLVVVFGNHDYHLGGPDEDADREQLDNLEQRLRELGAIVLRNERHELHAGDGGEALTIVGLDSLWADQVDIDTALHGLADDAPRIVLTHNPKVFDDLPAHTAPVVLAGHTHGGQIRFPFLPSSTSWLRIATQDEMFADGWSQPDRGNPGNRVYVNRGLGFSLLPMRFNCRPELTVFTLRGD